MNYASLAFTDTIKAIQQRQGSRTAYDRVEKMSYVDGLTSVEVDFINGMDSFYMASFGKNEFPYVQHRGGPRGFIKVIDNQTIGIIDFSGNKQYISVGNIAGNPKVSLIMVSYPMSARLKIYAEAELVGLADNPQLYELIKPQDYNFRPERIMLFHIKAYDWNCPQHITPRYTMPDIEEMMVPKDRYIQQLEDEVQKLKAKLKDKQ